MFCDTKELAGFHEVTIPHKYSTHKENLKYSLNKLTPLERLVYAAYHVSTLREIAHLLRRSHSGIKAIYIRACDKIETPKKG